VGSDLMLASVSGGTDVCTSFVGGSPLLPVRAGEITCRFLGSKVEAFDPSGHPVIGQQAELVITEPMPSMPVGFWGDDDGSRYRAAYFEQFPGVWCHGDWITITERATAVITGRSDATLNRGGIRMGTQEFYTAVEEVPEVSDSLVVHLEDPDGGMGELLLFVSMPAGTQLEEPLRDSLRNVLRARLSPRHVPNEIIQVPVIPRTITGKRLEVPVKRILSGVPLGPGARGSLADELALEPFVVLAARRHRDREITRGVAK
jgi:acetoacetyl-CoA synthetase